MPAATYTIEVGWAAVASNAFTFGRSTLDGGDVLSSQLYADFGGTYDDITGDVMHVEIERGRDDYLAAMPAGTLTVELTDPSGKYNPKNGSSVLAGMLLPMRPIRVRATHAGTTYDLFRGFIETIEWHPPPVNTAEITATDAFIWLSRVNPTVASTGSTTTGEAIGEILDAVGFTEASLRNLDDGDVIGDFSADGDTDALDLVTGLLDAERGVVFVDGAGVVTYRDRTALQLDTTVSQTISAVVDAVPGVNLDRIRNRATVTRTGGTTQTATDADSQGTYGWSDIPSIDTPYLATDDDAARLAAWLVSEAGAVASPIRGFTLSNLTSATLTSLLSLELTQRITVTDATAVSTSTDFTVEQIRHEITDGGRYHTATLTVRERTTDYFAFGISVLDGDDVIGY